MVSSTLSCKRRLKKMVNKLKSYFQLIKDWFKNKTKKDWLLFLFHIVLISLGCFSLAFATIVFYTKQNIVAGGLSGIAIIIQRFFPGYEIIDIVVWILTALLWIFSRICLSKEFAYKTLAASILYPLFLTLCYRIKAFGNLADIVAPTTTDGSLNYSSLILCSLFGGAFTGLGVALAFLGGGSTGGVDILAFMGEKYLRIKASVGSFLIDGLIIVIGMIFGVIEDPQYFVISLCGILSAFFSALVIDLLYNNMMTSYQIDIISSHYEEISAYAQDVLLRGATLIAAKGGYKGEDRPILRIVVPKMQYEKLRDYVASIDPSAFMTLTRTNAVFGEGFTENKSKRKKKNNG